MKNTTLCYIENPQGEYLMLHRVKKENDLNRDKWIGVGGKCEEDESPEECVCRETLEETGLTLTDYRYRGLVTFVSDRWEGEYMHLFTATGWTGTVQECNEGVLEWLHKDALAALPQWTDEAIHDGLIALAEQLGVKNATLMWPVRIAAAGKLVTPGGAVEICRILGRGETLRRLRAGLEKLA